MAEQGVEDAEVEFGLTVQHQAMPKERRYNKALVIAKDMASIVSKYGGEGFQQRLAVLAKMLKLLENDLKPGVLHLWLDRALKYDQSENLVKSSTNKLKMILTEAPEDPKQVFTASEDESIQEQNDTNTVSETTNQSLFPFKITRQPIKMPGRPKTTRPKPSSSLTSAAI
ncbi:hypothetical protein BV898_15674 [Hypsibius exemplaris]|uniref:Uncharacterized protein n=1 Tax=Hypsibius exemplaris TaxID=2072580 RepID=A0A9X6NED3_HYPEX|nr:hypothetical protein BV898_15674 [Hypsibius exemplaris]